MVDLLNPKLNTGEAKGDTFISIESVRGSEFSDILRGNNAPNGIGGWVGGNDQLFGRGGNDVLATWTGSDLLDGGTGRDTMTGGFGADRFDFNAVADSLPGASRRDVIQDFSSSEGDKIDLVTIDANAVVAGNQKFVFIGSATFANFHATHPGIIGMVRFAGGIVQGNVNANLAPDFEIRLAGVSSLAGTDFNL